VDGPINALWYTNGTLLWATPDGAMFAASFDPRRLRVTGAPVTGAQDVRLAVGGPAQVAVSKNGSMVYIPERPFDLVLVDQAGRRQTPTTLQRRFHSPRFSPNGRYLAVDFPQQGSRDVWTLDLQQGTMTRVTFANDGHDPVWSPDGRSITYASATSRSAIGIYRRRVDGSGAAESVYVGRVVTTAQTFSPDGRYIITAPSDANGAWDLGLLSLDGERRHETLIATPFSEAFAAIAPDGRWLAYVSDETGREEVYVRPFPEPGPRVMVSQNGGREPVWSRDGRRLFYIGDRQNTPFLVAADIRTTPEFAVLSRNPLFDVSEYEPANPHANYDVSRDGRQFAFVHQGPLAEIVYVMNVAGGR
jgi:serine/threonine-protein kinase